MFATFGLEGFERARPAALSGGMRQRVAFIRTLLAGRPLLCLDEPFAALDALTRAQAQTWLGEALAREPRTVLLVTHDVEEAVLLADRVVLLSPRPGRVVRDARRRAAAPARADGRRGGRAARARAAGAGGGGMSASRDTAPRKAAAPAEDPARVGTAAPRRAGSRLGRLVAPAVVLAILVAAWELVVRVGWVDELLLPAPTQVAQSLWEDRSLLAPDLLDDHVRGGARPRRLARCSASRWRWRCTWCRRSTARCGRW